MLKSYWVVVVGVGGGLQDFSVSPRPLGFGFLCLGLSGLGPGLDNRAPLPVTTASLVFSWLFFSNLTNTKSKTRN